MSCLVQIGSVDAWLMAWLTQHQHCQVNKAWPRGCGGGGVGGLNREQNGLTIYTANESLFSSNATRKQEAEHLVHTAFKIQPCVNVHTKCHMTPQS